VEAVVGAEFLGMIFFWKISKWILQNDVIFICHDCKIWLVFCCDQSLAFFFSEP
jgi:hypothetical protein